LIGDGRFVLDRRRSSTGYAGGKGSTRREVERMRREYSLNAHRPESFCVRIAFGL